MTSGSHWDGPKIKMLRLRLGWSQAELARRLHTESVHVLDWEEEFSFPDDDFKQQLELLAKQAQMSADEVSETPLLEVFLDEAELSQCDFSSSSRREKK